MLCAALTTFGCGESDAASGPGDGGKAATGGAAAPAAVELKPVDPATAGSITGVVRYGPGKVTPEFFKMIGDAWCMQHNPPDGGYLDNRIVVGPGGGLSAAFVWIKRGLDGYSFPTPKGTVVIDQKNCLYTPRVQGATAGQRIEVHTSDQTMHNVHVEAARKNVAMLPGSKPLEINIRNPPEMVEFKCDVHAWMKGWICVVPHPIWQLTGDDGAFSLQGVPPGEYTLQVWHESLGTRDIAVTVGESQTVALDPVVLGS